MYNQHKNRSNSRKGIHLEVEKILALLLGLTLFFVIMPISSFSEESDSFSSSTSVIASSSTSSSSSTDQPPHIIQKLEDAHDKLSKVMAYKSEIESHGFSQIILNEEDLGISSIPLFLSHIDENSMLMVGIEADAPLPKEEYYKMLENVLGSDIPLKIGFGYFIREGCASPFDTCDPIWGGINVESEQDVEGNPNQSGTLNIPVSNTNGVKGFIMSGHVAGNVGNSVGQPLLSTRTIGTVLTNPNITNRTSDSAFVQFSQGITSETKIFTLDGALNVIGTTTSAETPSSTPVNMMGSGTSDVVSGFIFGTGLTVTDDIGVLRNQVGVTYVSVSGDSGGPVFSNDTNDVYYYGIHVGKLCFNAPPFTPKEDCPDPIKGWDLFTVYSPWEEIQDELSVEICAPPTIGDWILTVDCSIDSDITAPNNVIVQNNAVLTVPSGVTLDIDFASKHLLIKSGSGVMIKSGGKIT